MKVKIVEQVKKRKWEYKTVVVSGKELKEWELNRLWEGFDVSMVEGEIWITVRKEIKKEDK